MMRIRPPSMKSLVKAGLVICSVGVGIGGTLAYQSWQRTTSTKTEVIPREPLHLKTALLIQGDPSLGSPKAPITIVEFSDFECPYCQRFHDDILPKIQSEYINKGLVRFVHKDLPLPYHNNAKQAAHVARCSMEQDDYWLAYKALFKRQNCLDCQGALSITTSAGLNETKLKRCLKSKEVASIVNSNRSEAQLNGIRATPTFVIGPSQGDKHHGDIIEGALPWPQFQQLIEKALANTRNNR
ncbi:DsbA family protein [Prochlorococcus sp. MIT 1201]|uniref:DsbA family protein n=1 Tax=Prochlorococcus sp. MIT 1201 TaxID=3082535 RepID=UPI0039A67D22